MLARGSSAHTEWTAALPQSFSSPGLAARCPLQHSSRSHPRLFSEGPPGTRLCTAHLLPQACLYVLERALQGAVADLVNLSPVTLQPLSLISSKDSTRTVMEHGGKPATLKPRAAKSHANEGWQAPACGWFENQFLIVPAGMTSIVSQTKTWDLVQDNCFHWKITSKDFQLFLATHGQQGWKGIKRICQRMGRSLHPPLIYSLTCINST